MPKETPEKPKSVQLAEAIAEYRNAMAVAENLNRQAADRFRFADEIKLVVDKLAPMEKGDYLITVNNVPLRLNVYVMNRPGDYHREVTIHEFNHLETDD